jgi:hypothetical protein
MNTLDSANECLTFCRVLSEAARGTSAWLFSPFLASPDSLPPEKCKAVFTLALWVVPALKQCKRSGH